MSLLAAGSAKYLTHAPNGIPLSPVEKYVLLVMSDYHDDESGDVECSTQELAARTLLTIDKVRGALRLLGSRGALEDVSALPASSDAERRMYRFPWLEV